MRYRFDHDFHIHSFLSSCSSDKNQSAERILKYALENELERICVTDHCWDDSVPGASEWYKHQNVEWVSKILPLPNSEKVKFMFGAETEMDKDLTIGMSLAHYDKFDFVIVPTTHLNNAGFGISEEDAQSAEGRAETWMRKFEGLLSYKLPYRKMGVAHLACGLIAPKDRAQYLSVLDLLPEDRLVKSFKKAEQLGIGIELNASDMSFKDEEAETVLRIFEIAKRCGCKFYLGSDAHHPKNLDNAKKIFERAIDCLELKESDKFHINN